MAWKEGGEKMKKAAQHVFFDLVQTHPFIIDGLYLYTEQKSIMLKKRAARE